MEYEKVDDLKRIKKEYGENMMHLCRSLFPTILDTPGALYHILSTHFAKSKSLYGDITREHKEYLFKEYIYDFFDTNKEIDTSSNKSVKELLDEAGYEIFECKANEDIQKFRKYYAPGEELCTFKDPHRIDNHHIFFIVKKDVDKIKREDFANPQREDDYGVSVLDLQFDKGDRQRVSIKSRYNHTVNNPDSTYSNNLESIIPGLTEAFEREYGFNIGQEYKLGFELDHYVKARDGKYYKFNYEIDNIHYCPNNIIIDNGDVVDKYADKSRYLVMDYFILDMSQKRIDCYDTFPQLCDSFADELVGITNIIITNEEDYKKVELTTEQGKAIIKLDSNNRIIGYENNYKKTVGYDFLLFNNTLRELNMPELRSCGDNFLFSNNSLVELNMPKLQSCGDCFLFSNRVLSKSSMPELRSCGDKFLFSNNSLIELNMPKLQSCGDYFLRKNESIRELNLPQLKKCGGQFLPMNTKISKLNLPELQECGSNFLSENDMLMMLDLPQLQKCGSNFLLVNNMIEVLNLPELQECGDNFICSNSLLWKFDAPKLQECGDNFLRYNSSLNKISLPNLKKCGTKFLENNSIIKYVYVPKLKDENIGDGFLAVALSKSKENKKTKPESKGSI